VTIAGAPHSIVATQLLGPGGQVLTVWQWYWIDGTITSSDAYAKALTAWSRLRGRGDDSAAVIVYAPVTDSRRATATLQTFTRDAWPAIAGVLARTAQGK
jgi:EpsI family protein